MTDILEILPDFDLKPYSHLIHSFEKYDITVADLVTVDAVEIVRRCPLPLLDVRRLAAEIVEKLQNELDRTTKTLSTHHDIQADGGQSNELDIQSPNSAAAGLARPGYIRTLDTSLDGALVGGIPIGYVTEIAGESSAGKTQFVLGFLLSVQLPPPQGLGRNALYISTEGTLNTSRLIQMLTTHPAYQNLDDEQRPSTDRVRSMTLNDLEAQEHIIQYLLPVAIDRYDVGVVVIDSITANFRAEHETRTASGLADRASALTKLGSTLRHLAVDKNIAVIVVNQVSDRFDETLPMSTPERVFSSSPTVSSSPLTQKPTTAPATSRPLDIELLTLDHQQRFFTGWGDKPSGGSREQLKTPALGLTWTNHISARVVLKMQAERTRYAGGNLYKDRKRRRFLEVVFAPWAPSTIEPVEYEIVEHGIASVSDRESQNRDEPMSDLNLLDADFWIEADEEFP